MGKYSTFLLIVSVVTVMATFILLIMFVYFYSAPQYIEKPVVIEVPRLESSESAIMVMTPAPTGEIDGSTVQ